MDAKTLSAILGLLPLDGRDATMDAFEIAKSFEMEEASPRVLNNGEVDAGWRAFIQGERYPTNRRSISSLLTGTQSQTFSALDGYPVTVAAVVLEHISTQNEQISNVTLLITVKRIKDNEGAGTFDVQTYTLQGQAYTGPNGDTRCIILCHFADVLRNFDPTTNTAKDLPERCSRPGALAVLDDAENGDFTEITVSVTTNNPNLKTSVQLVTPGSSLWDNYVSSLLTDKANPFLDAYSVDNRART
jgi:hypothetical protein